VWSISCRPQKGPSVRFTVRRAMIVVAVAAIGIIGMLILMKAIRGNEHWILSTQDRDGGMVIRVRCSGSARPGYTVFVEGYSLGRDIAPLVIDRDRQRFPEGMSLTFEDTTLLPGRCTLRIGPLTLDVMEARLIADGQKCDPGGEITVRVSPPL
jgi:hypothetical protein